MDKVQTFPCPNCGAYGTRRYFVSQDPIHRSCANQQVMTTECSICDYLMTMCSLDGKVIETSSLPFAVVSEAVKPSANPETLAIKQKIIKFKSKISA